MRLIFFATHSFGREFYPLSGLQDSKLFSSWTQQRTKIHKKPDADFCCDRLCH